jgi:hypothetical protein
MLTRQSDSSRPVCSTRLCILSGSDSAWVSLLLITFSKRASDCNLVDCLGTRVIINSPSAMSLGLLRPCDADVWKLMWARLELLRQSEYARGMQLMEQKITRKCKAPLYAIPSFHWRAVTMSTAWQYGLPYAPYALMPGMWRDNSSLQESSTHPTTRNIATNASSIPVNEPIEILS